MIGFWREHPGVAADISQLVAETHIARVAGEVGVGDVEEGHGTGNKVQGTRLRKASEALHTEIGWRWRNQRGW